MSEIFLEPQFTYIEAPTYVDWQKDCYVNSMFMGGGITGCRDWQADFVNYFRSKNLPVTLFNPRRLNFNVNDKSLTPEQIDWEFYHLREAKINVFWFSHETLQPITLLELGGALERFKGNPRHLIVGSSTGFMRLDDIKYQCEKYGVKVILDWNEFLHTIEVQIL